MSDAKRCDGCGQLGEAGYTHAWVEWAAFASKAYDFCAPYMEDIRRAYKTLRSARKNGRATARDRLTRWLGGSA